MSDSMYGAQRKKRRPRERPFFRDKDFREPYGARSESYYQDSKEKSSASVVTSPVMKAPVILAKPDSIPKARVQSPSPVEEVAPTERPQYSHTRHERPQTYEAKHYYPKGSGFKSYSGKSTHNAKPGFGTPSNQEHSSSKSSKDTSGEHKPVKLVDANLRWTDSGVEQLDESQTHFLVVGILGEQGVGKSALMSYLTGGEFIAKDTIFPCQSRDNVERASNKTVGIDMYITEERTIFLDSQPILSPSLLEQCIYNDRKLSGDFNGPAAGIEMQSLQIVSFLFSVCHVVIVMQDWFGDTKLYDFIQCAEMLRLTSDSSHSDNDSDDFYPHLVFAFNKTDPELFDPANIKSISATISSVFAHSKLLYRSSISLQKSSLFPELSLSLPPAEEVNLFLIPTIENADADRSDEFDSGLSDDAYFETLPNYGELPESADIMNALKKMILSIRNVPLTRKQLTEKGWYYYAAKMWEGIKKSQMMAEFNRLLG